MTTDKFLLSLRNYIFIKCYNPAIRNYNCCRLIASNSFVMAMLVNKGISLNKNYCMSERIKYACKLKAAALKLDCGMDIVFCSRKLLQKISL